MSHVTNSARGDRCGVNEQCLYLDFNHATIVSILPGLLLIIEDVRRSSVLRSFAFHHLIRKSSVFRPLRRILEGEKY